MQSVRSRRITVCFFICFGAFLLQNTYAQNAQNPPAQNTPDQNTPGQNATGQNSATQNTPAPNKLAVKPKVTSLEGNIEADDLIRVFVENLEEWSKTNDPHKLVPYLNGIVIRGNYPMEIHPSQGHLQFHLRIEAHNREAWVDLLGAPSGVKRPILFSVGLENQQPFDSVYDTANRLPLTIISPVYGVIAAAVVIVTLGLLVWLARKTSIIREPGPPPPPGKRRPYNLGRAQMAFWFFLVYASYVVIWLITDALDTITPSLLGLMGISAGTALSEALIDSGKAETRTNQLQEMTSEKQALEPSIPDLQTQLNALNSKDSLTPDDISNRDSISKRLQDGRARLSQLNKQISDATPDAADTYSAGFLRDLLSDGNGYSFHRFQIFAWTIVLGIIFVSSVYNSLSMPEFSTTLLGLMGISSGTYIGFKFPEQR